MSIIRLIYILSPLVALLAGVYSFKYLDKKLKLLFFYVVVGFCTEILVFVALKSGFRNTIPGLHFYIMFEFFVWIVFYINSLHGYINRKFIVTIAVLFEIYCVVNFLFIQDLKTYPFTRTIEDLLLIFLSIMFFLKIMKDADIKNLARSPSVWINTSVLLYFAGNFFYNIVFIHLLINDGIFLKNTGVYIFGLFNFLYYSGISVAFLLQRKNSRTLSVTG